jgi:hypothetical protein
VVHALLVARNIVAVTVTAAALLALGADLTMTAYAASHTAQTVLLAANV